MKLIRLVHITSIVLVLFVVSAGYYVYGVVRESEEQVRRISAQNAIVNDVFSLNILTADYIIFGTERADLQWRKKYEDIGRRIGVSGADGRGLSEQIVKRYEKIGDVFRDLVSGRRAIASEDREEYRELRASLERRLSAKLFLESEALASSFAEFSADQTEILIESQRRASRILYALFLGMLSVFLGAALFVVRRVVNPIIDLERKVRKMHAGTGSPANMRLAGSERKDEIGVLTRSFIAMNRRVADAYHDLEQKIRDRTRELERVKMSLEREVANRTKELHRVNQNLEMEVSHRTKELQEKLEEVRKFNEIMMGRELKMIELKKRIGELEDELRKCGK